MADEGDPRYLVVGHVTKAHGIKGELYVRPLTDHPDATYLPGVTLTVTDSSGAERVSGPASDDPSLEIVSARPFKKGLLVKLEGIDDRSRAEGLRGRYLARPFHEVPPLEEGEVFYHQLLGMRVEAMDGRELGTVREVFEVGSGHLAEIRGPAGTFHIPLVHAMVDEVDVERNRLILDPPPGLIDEAEAVEP